MGTAGPPEAVRGSGGPLPSSAVVAGGPGIPAPRDPVDHATPGLPAWRPHRWGLGAYLLAEAVFLGSSVLLVLPFVGHHHRPGDIPPAILLLSLTVPTMLAAGVALLATRLRGNGPAVDLGPLEPQAEMFAGQHFSVPVAVAVFLVVWLVAPVCEEIVYRGLLWGALRRHVAGRWWVFGLTTLCFALAHFEFTRTPLLLVIGVPIGLARLCTDRLGASIVAHQLNNLLPAVSLLMLLLGAPL